jgi:hypothetical protein
VKCNEKKEVEFRCTPFFKGALLLTILNLPLSFYTPFQADSSSYLLGKRDDSSEPRVNCEMQRSSEEFTFVALRTFRGLPYLKLPQTSRISLHFAIYPSPSSPYLRRVIYWKNLGKNCEMQRKVGGSFSLHYALQNWFLISNYLKPLVFSLHFAIYPSPCSYSF